MRLRRGFSLVELLVVLTVGTAMLMVAMSVLYMLKETQINVRRRLTEGRMINRLADQFREDVHQSRGMERVPDQRASPGNELWRITIGPDGVDALDGLLLEALTASQSLTLAGSEMIGNDRLERYERC